VGLRRGVAPTRWAGAGRRPRLEDVAERAGVSTASVSLVLRDAPGPSRATRERVARAAEELGYRPDRTASLLARRRTRLLGVVLDIRSPFHTELVADLHDASDVVGYDLVLSTITRTRTEPRAIETLLDSRCEALVLLGPEVPVSTLQTLARQVPVVVVGRRVSVPGVDVVRSADDQGIAAAVDHLVGLGHRRVAHVDGGRGTIATDRRNGYRRAMRRHGLERDVLVLPGDHAEGAGIAAAHTLLAAGELPTGVVTFNDQVAVGLLDGLARAGVHVPADVSVVGYDDSSLARMAHVDLTTVSQQPHQQAEDAVAAAVERLDGGRVEDRRIVLPPRLVVRGTTGPAAPGQRPPVGPD
jgi:DNA-binding LacI/PurR family transcriptional regulator